MVTPRLRLRVAVVALLLALPLRGATPVPADVYLLKNGDRLSGRTVFKGKRLFGLLTAYGRLNIPREQVARVQWSDGREEILAAVDSGDAALTLALVLVVTGRSFWQAWDPSDVPADTTLRLQVSVDETPIATYVDARSDPDDLPGAIVNTFHFAVEDVRVQTASGVAAAAPETRPGRIALRLRLLAAHAGEHRLRVAYQVNLGTPTAPAWHDASEAVTPVAVRYEAPAIVELAQDAGRMEFTRRHMRHVDTFRITARAGAPRPAAELDSPRPES
jgi:hypothetical protein